MSDELTLKELEEEARVLKERCFGKDGELLPGYDGEIKALVETLETMILRLVKDGAVVEALRTVESRLKVKSDTLIDVGDQEHAAGIDLANREVRREIKRRSSK